MGTINPSVLLIYTGGTIGMVEDPDTGSLQPIDFNTLLETIPELNRFDIKIDWKSFENPIDSSNADRDVWVQIVDIIAQHYEEYTGFVILHGTDTMSYTASALSFMLENLDKPVILTGSQLPLGKLRTDGKENLVTAVEIDGMIKNNRPVLNEVAIYFEDFLFRGNRTYKYNADNFDAFDSPNYPELARAGIHIFLERDHLLPPTAEPLVVRRNMDNRVAVLTFFPGMKEEVFRSMLAINDLKALVMYSFGAGNVPQVDWLSRAMSDARERGIILVNVSQCKRGFVEQGRYATSNNMVQNKVWNAGDMTLEATLAKLMYLLGLDLNFEEMELAFHSSLRGERTTFTSLV